MLISRGNDTAAYSSLNNAEFRTRPAMNSRPPAPFYKLESRVIIRMGHHCRCCKYTESPTATIMLTGLHLCWLIDCRHRELCRAISYRGSPMVPSSAALGTATSLNDVSFER